MLFNLFLLFVIFESVTPKADFARLQRIKPWDITITKNGYNIVAGISEEIPESSGPILIENLKVIMTSASRELFRITG